MTAVGSRVFAVRDADADEVRVFGFGVYDGDLRRPASDAELAEYRQLAADAVRASDAAPPIDVDAAYDQLVADGRLTRAEADAEIAAAKVRIGEQQARPLAERVDELVDRLLANPRISLDDGGVVWGFQCWWAPEERFDEMAAGRRVVTVPVPAS